MEVFERYGLTLLLIGLMVTMLWLISVPLEDASIIALVQVPQRELESW